MVALLEESFRDAPAGPADPAPHVISDVTHGRSPDRQLAQAPQLTCRHPAAA
ncbi:hypothetical protein [Mycolicibacterium fortuitum]|uniref:hypothetical protein n=1 Tax=Mycolicibacterium fortuitum TaxID=1766 RepID=UPI0013F4D8C1|nr:hypothetical protein [Mycolicibacterium fortuitum]